MFSLLDLEEFQGQTIDSENLTGFAFEAGKCRLQFKRIKTLFSA